MMTVALIVLGVLIVDFAFGVLVGKTIARRDSDEAMAAANRRAQVMAGHPSGGRDQRAWAAVVGQDNTVTRPSWW